MSISIKNKTTKIYLVHHLLASSDQDGGGDCHGHQRGQAITNEVEQFQACY